MSPERHVLQGLLTWMYTSRVHIVRVPTERGEVHVCRICGATLVHAEPSHDLSCLIAQVDVVLSKREKP